MTVELILLTLFCTLVLIYCVITTFRMNKKISIYDEIGNIKKVVKEVEQKNAQLEEEIIILREVIIGLTKELERYRIIIETMNNAQTNNECLGTDETFQ